MQTNNLPTADLKKYGIIGADNAFSKKLSANDIQKFLQGYTIVADNGTKRATFQLVDGNRHLNVIFLERDRKLAEILKNSRETIEYSTLTDLSSADPLENVKAKAFLLDPKINQIVELDLIRNARELTEIIAGRNKDGETMRYKNELLKLKSDLLDKIDQFPGMAKDISNDLNIVTKEISIINMLPQNSEVDSDNEKSAVQLNVNDPDLYQEANRLKEEEGRLPLQENKQSGPKR